MNRRNFLAFIPAISALPLVGKEIIQKPDKIEIYQPEELKSHINYDALRLEHTAMPLKLAVMHGEEVIGTGWVTALNVSSHEVDITTKDYNNTREYLTGARTVTIEGILNVFHPNSYT